MKARYVLLILVIAFWSGIASADSFSGAYAPANWVVSSWNSNGSVSWSVPGSVTIYGSDNGNYDGDPSDAVGGYEAITIAAPAAGTVIFNWSYTTYDSGGAAYDPAFYADGTWIQLSPNAYVGGPQTYSGSESFAVNAGELLGFEVETVDNLFGPANLTISDFVDPPAAVPEPGSLFLLGSGVFGLAGILRRKLWL